MAYLKNKDLLDFPLYPEFAVEQTNEDGNLTPIKRYECYIVTLN